MKRIYFISISIYQFLFLSSFAQLSGTYTIGGIAPDFNTITEAASALGNGISGYVVFNIRPGVYHEQIESYYTGTTDSDSITFQSENLDSTSVLVWFDSYSAVISFSNSNALFIYRSLTLTNSMGYAITGKNTKIEKCVLTSGNYAVSCSYGKTEIFNNQINGKIDIWFSTTATLFFENTVNGEVRTDKIICSKNRIDGLSFRAWGIIENNELNTRLFINGNSIVKKNYIAGGVDISYAGGTKIIDNDVPGQVNVGYSDGCHLIGNEFLAQLYFSFSNGCLFANNFIFKSAEFAFSNYCGIFFNNFSLDTNTFLLIQSDQCQVKNNNLPKNVWAYNSTIFSNNNYYYGNGLNDTAPQNTDPQYNSSGNLWSCNYQLAGKGIFYYQVLYDKDSIPRSNPPSIGANEICFSSDTVSVLCGDDITLSLCGAPLNGNYIWTPASGLSNSSSSKPVATVTQNIKYVVKELNSGYMDSIYLTIESFLVKTINDTLIFCGDSILLAASYNAGAIYQWMPQTGLSDPVNYFSIAKPAQSTIYVIGAFVPGCGYSYDTVNISVDPMPSALTYYDENCKTAFFYNRSTCATSYFWDFGDSTYSIVENPSHDYNFPGTKTIMLIAYNDYGSDTLSGSIYISPCTGIEFSSLQEELSVFPNPASGNISFSFRAGKSNVNYQIIDLVGKTIAGAEICHQEKNSITTIDLSNLADGIYFLKIKTQDQIILRRFLKVK